MATAIYVENINKSFGDCTIFKDYSLSVEDGEFILINDSPAAENRLS